MNRKQENFIERIYMISNSFYLRYNLQEIIALFEILQIIAFS